MFRKIKSIILIFVIMALSSCQKQDNIYGAHKKNVVLILVDALRADHLGCYGYKRPTSPNIDKLAQEGVLFERAVTQFPATGPSFGSIFTAKYPRRHGLPMMDPRYKLGQEFNITLAEILKKNGYATAAIMTGAITRSSGLARGFDYYFEEMAQKRSFWARLQAGWIALGIVNDGNFIANIAMRWIKKNKQKPFFAFVHLYHTHAPYNPPQEYINMFASDYEGKYKTYFNIIEIRKEVKEGKILFSNNDIKHIIALYDAEVRTADEAVGEIIKNLDKLGILNNTIVILTADHGEELYEHKVFGHGFIYNTNLLVPLIIYSKGDVLKDTRFKEAVELIDVMPTILDILDIAAPKEIDGISLSPYLSSPKSNNFYAFSEANYPYGSLEWKIAVQDAHWKLVIGKKTQSKELYNLANDPYEHNNCYDKYPDTASTLEKILIKWDESQPDLNSIVKYKEDQETKGRLKALGYLQ